MVKLQKLTPRATTAVQKTRGVGCSLSTNLNTRACSPICLRNAISAIWAVATPYPLFTCTAQQALALSAAFITAWNPFSQNLPAKENQARHDELKANIKKRGLVCIDGIGKHPSNNWPGEVSVLVLDLDLEEAKSLARQYEQHAFVWTLGDCVPQLIQP
jgi:hypothetical protein